MTFWLIVTTAILGHFAIHLGIYNRLNATGLRRETIKRIEKLFIATCLVIPIAIALSLNLGADLWASSVESLESLELWIQVYGVICISTILVYGIPWLLWRPLFGLEWIDAPRKIRIVNVDAVTNAPLAISRKCKWQAKVPYNQIFQLAIEEIELPVNGLPAALDGLRISHLSDLHFTGDISPEFTRYVIEESNQWRPDLCVITGDIIDKHPCIAWLQPIFAAAKAPDGKYFILGNHDKRIADTGEIRRELQACSWVDMGGRSELRSIRDCEIEIIGNESPWFPAPNIDVVRPSEASPFRLLLSHSPDQIWWARKRGIGLMLAGHTHGGQGRLPLAGPLLSPSWHGSRFASGDFYKAPTTLHVSRGLGGVHLLRWNCRPELSLLTLRRMVFEVG